ncbi:hypothetical protein CISIN_1g0059433mg, partial [Citrus sinensis]
RKLFDQYSNWAASAYGNVALWNSMLSGGKQVHAFCVKRGFEKEDVTLTSLIDMYLKCGEIDDGLALFNFMPERDVVSWTGIIVG